MMSNETANAEEVNWADYCDALVHEAWLESQKSNSPIQKAVPRKEPELMASKHRFQSEGRDVNP